MYMIVLVTKISAAAPSLLHHGTDSTIITVRVKYSRGPGAVRDNLGTHCSVSVDNSGTHCSVNYYLLCSVRYCTVHHIVYRVVIF